jgi:hypothetical protein
MAPVAHWMHVCRHKAAAAAFLLSEIILIGVASRIGVVPLELNIVVFWQQ